MAYADLAGVRIHYQIDRAPRESATWLVLSNSLGTDMTMWAPQMQAFTRHFHVLRYDARGHGRSDAPPGPYTVEQWAGDVLGLLDRQGIGCAHFCGISMGGLIGLALAARHAERINKLVVSNSAAKIGSAEIWNARIDGVRTIGMPGMVESASARWFTPEFTARAGDTTEKLRTVLAGTDAEGYAATCAALRDTDLRDEVWRISVPTLVIAGEKDASTTLDQGEWLAGAITGARLVALDAAHISNWEQATSFTNEVLGFLSQNVELSLRGAAGCAEH